MVASARNIINQTKAAEYTLDLFNGVLAETSGAGAIVDTENGVVIEAGAQWALGTIAEYIQSRKLSGQELNKTFHKSWEKIATSDRFELMVEQIKHYLSTYGTDFEGEVYIPDEILNIPETQVKFVVIKAFTRGELVDKALAMLESGMALKEDTIEKVLFLLGELGYTFTSESLDLVRNKEAIVKIATTFGVFPSNPLESFRIVLYKTTGTTTLIKNREMIAAIKASKYDPSADFRAIGEENLAQIFNRFKPLFLAYKSKDKTMVNRIAKLSKKLHKPMVQNPLNLVTSRALTAEDTKWLERATVYHLFKALNALNTRYAATPPAFLYKIRNGKTYAVDNSESKSNPFKESLDAGIKTGALQVVATGKNTEKMWLNNMVVIIAELRKRISMHGKTVYIPANIEYALPTSEKQYVGNIPMGTRIIGDKLAAGVYWRDEWGARDIDLSGISLAGKIGWNSHYNMDGLLYSGDITSAPDGAVEYLYTQKGQAHDTLVLSNIFSGKDDAGYRIVVGEGDDMSVDYMMNPNNVIMDERTQSVQRQTVLGLLSNTKDGKVAFSIMNVGLSGLRVSGSNANSMAARAALIHQMTYNFTLNRLLAELGANVVDTLTPNMEASEEDQEQVIDLSFGSLERDTFTQLFNGE